MRRVDVDTNTAWRSPVKSGDTAPMQRVTVQRLDQKFLPYLLQKVEGSHRKGRGKLAMAVFGQQARPKELPNVKSIQWTRSIEQDVATCTIVCWNTRALPLGSTQDDETVFDQPGWFTYNRGDDTTNPWGQDVNDWRNRLVPDRIIRTYEGYGFDPEQPPEKDPHMYPSGVWLIDDVTYTHDGLITIQCRDIGRALIDQICFPPVVPYHEYPLSWSAYQWKAGNPDKVRTELISWSTPTYDTDSNIPYIGQGFTDGPYPYVQQNGSVRGHNGKDAFDGQKSSYWLSVGNLPHWSSAFEYVQGKFSSRTIHGIRLNVWGGPYRVYISVFADGEWKGRGTIPYAARAVDTNADIKFVKHFTVDKDDEVKVKLPKPIQNATKIRLTFTDLYNTGIGYYKYRAGVREIEVSSAKTSVDTVEGPLEVIGNYGDYTDIVKWLCAWGGFYWPKSGTGLNKLTLSDGSQVTIAAAADDDNGVVYPDYIVTNIPKDQPELPLRGFLPAARGGNVWGDWEFTGTAGVVDLGIDIWDKKPLMDGIKYIKDIVGFNFYIDETGGIVWRPPNIYKRQNVLNPVDGGPKEGWTDDSITISEEDVLMSLSAKISSANSRERIFVANVNGRTGAVVQGYVPFKSKLRRIGGWTDQHFETNRECTVMAELIAVQQLFSWRTDTAVIPGNPAIQIDDQIQIQERVTGESFFHYVMGISSDWDITSGKWTYTLQTHWLGTHPDANWWYKGLKLSDVTQRYLNVLTGHNNKSYAEAIQAINLTDDGSLSGSPFDPVGTGSTGGSGGGGATGGGGGSGAGSSGGGGGGGQSPTYSGTYPFRFGSNCNPTYDQVYSLFGGASWDGNNIWRTFSSGLPSSYNNWGDAAKQKNNVPVILSFKPPVAATIAGNYDTQIHNLLMSIPQNRTCLIAAWHEPEDQVENGAFTAAQWRALQAKLRTLINNARTAGQTNLHQITIGMAVTLTPHSPRNPDDFYYSGTDYMGYDCYQLANLTYVKNYCVSKGKRYFIPEFAPNFGADAHNDSLYASEIENYVNTCAAFGSDKPEGMIYFNGIRGKNSASQMSAASNPVSVALWKSYCTTGAAP